MMVYIDVFKLNDEGAKMQLSDVNELNQMSEIAVKEYNRYVFNNRSITYWACAHFTVGYTAYGYSDHGAFLQA